MKNIILICFLWLLASVSFADQLIIEPDNGRAPLLSAIQKAKSSIDLTLYGLTDKKLMDSLIDAKNHGKEVRILIEPAPYKNPKENNAAIKKLLAHHIFLQSANPDFKLTHQKTFLIDHQSAIIMTFNLTKSAFNQERNFALTINDPATIAEMMRVFSADLSHKKILVSNTHLVWSPDQAREKITALIQQAQSNIKIYAPDISDYQIIGELAKKSRAGIKIEILTSANENIHPKKWVYLKKSGVIIHHSTQYLIHAKVIIIDQKRAMLGSTNLTEPSLDQNRELSIITEDPDVIRQLTTTFDWDCPKNDGARSKVFVN
ncbi:MAG: putative membrane associated protein [uncultured bacterium]|nr:MAG: putative membrane associated protein [uncultured bacterium]